MAQSLRSSFKVRDPFFEIEVEGIKTLETGKAIDKKAVIHKESGEVISVVNPDWNIIQNKALIESFEDSLREDKIDFVRSEAGVNSNLTKFWANYRFPEIRLTLDKPYKTNFGVLQDDIELSIDLWGGYAAGISTGFMLGGMRKICMNGLVRKEALSTNRWNHREIKHDDLLEVFSNKVIEAKDLFQSAMIRDWNLLSDTPYDKQKDGEILLYLYREEFKNNKTYRERLHALYREYNAMNKLKTKWDFYNMLTWFFTHVIEKNSRQRSQRISHRIGNMLMGELN